jgi:hypothetical protein
MKNAARTAALIAVPTPAKLETAKEAPGGWDPYEVWRTRVLMPRLDAHLVAADRVPLIVASTKR